ncbi:MAG: TnpV protein [Acutalibacteraceae bacterium]|nr:TnpV protein [Acutalibacteraceae bacterium]
MEQLAKFITDERTGLKYELCGDYYIIAGEDEPECEPIGLWGQRHLKHIQKHCKPFYNKMLNERTLYDYLLQLNRDAEETFSELVKRMAIREGVTEKLKAENQLEWVGRMNNIRSRATEIVNHDIIYT